MRRGIAGSLLGTGRFRRTYGIALGTKRCRLLSINVISPTLESVWIPSGNGLSENGSRAAAGSSENTGGVSLPTRLITIPPPHFRGDFWALWEAGLPCANAVPQGLVGRRSDLPRFTPW